MIVVTSDVMGLINDIKKGIVLFFFFPAVFILSNYIAIKTTYEVSNITETMKQHKKREEDIIYGFIFWLITFVWVLVIFQLFNIIYFCLILICIYIIYRIFNWMSKIMEGIQ